MGSVPLHPAIVHLPLGIAFIIPFLALVATVALSRRKATKKSWAVIVALQALLFLGGLAAMKTGEQEEERAEDVVAESAINQHEAAAAAFTWGAGAALAVAAAVMVLPAPAVPLGAAAASLVMLVVLGLGVRVGHAGGRLVYVHNAGAAYATTAQARAGRAAAGSERGAEQAGARGERDGDDDDR